MKPQVRAFYGDEDVTFVQDNAGIHTAYIVQDWFDENPQFKVLDWPAKSPVGFLYK